MMEKRGTEIIYVVGNHDDFLDSLAPFKFSNISIVKDYLRPYSSSGSYLHGYLLNSGFSEEIRSWHSRHPSVPMHFFWDKKDQRAEVIIDDCLSFHQLDDTLFLRYMSGAKAYATTAGFESVCEAMYLNKPVLMVPTHIEQACNAYDASLSGAGVVADCFDLDALLSISESHVENPVFRHWVKQVCHADGTGVPRRWHGCAMPMTWVCHQRGTEVLFIQRLLNICNNIIGVLDTYREADQVRSHASLYQLFIAQLAVRMTGRVKHASTGIRYVSYDSGEFQAIHKLDRHLTSTFQSEG